jgi:hypothetical protein
MIEIGAKTEFLRLCTKNKQNLRQGAQMGACRRYVVDALDICCPSKAAEVGAQFAIVFIAACAHRTGATGPLG